MVSYNISRGHALRIAVGITMLALIMMMLSVMTQISLAKELKENIDYKCIDKGVTSNPLPKIKAVEDKNFTPLCSNGKVPKAINFAEQSLELDKKIKRFPNYSIDNKNMSQFADCSTYGACYDWADSRLYISNNGVAAYLTQHDPKVSTDSYHSIAEIGILNSTAGSWPGDYVETGWRKASGDVTRLFTFWWKDGVGQCYNDLCNGWVQVSTKYYPGMPLNVDNYGKLYAIQTGPYWNLWVWYNDDWVGYYPASLWNNQFTGGDLALYYGEVASKNSITDTEMGSGFWASNISAAEFIDPQFSNSSGWNPVQKLDKIISARNLYTLEPYFDKYYSGRIRYGGPGGEGSGGIYCSILDIKYPNSGISLYAGQKTFITWNYEGCAGPYVKLELLKPDGSLASTIVNSAEIGDAGFGKYPWDIPLNFEPGDYKIKITSSYLPDLYWNESSLFNVKKDHKYMVFARGSDQALWYRQFDGISWGPWQSPGGSITNLDATSSESNVYAFVRGEDGGLWDIKWDGTSWSSWQSLGGSITDLDSISTNNVYAFARGIDGGLWYRNLDGTSWNSWQSLGGFIFNITSAASGANNLDVFVRGTDGGLWYRNLDGTLWGSWQSLGGSITDLDATSSGNNVYAFARGVDGGLWYRNLDGTLWGSWQSLGGSITHLDSVSSGNNVYVFVRGADGGLWYRNLDGSSWSSWQSLGGSITNLDAASFGSTVYVFAQGVDRGLWYRNLDGTSWSDWQSLGGSITDLDATS